MRNPLLFLLIVFCSACVPESKRIPTEVVTDHNERNFHRLANLQHHQVTDSLRLFLSDPDPSTRFLATRAFASVADPSALDSLYTLLNDPVMKIRSMAAYAIGQQKMSNSEDKLIGGFRQKDTMSVDNSGNGAILEAIGKLGSLPLAKYIATADGYRKDDTLLMEGQVKSLYRFALNGINPPAATQKALDVIKDRTLAPKARLYAAHYFARSQDLDIDAIKFQLAEELTLEQDPHVKMALALGLKHTTDPEIETILLNQLRLDQDYRITCNLIRTLTSYESDSVEARIIPLLRHPNQHIALAAVDYVSQKADPNQVKPYRDIASDSIPWQVSSRLFGAILKVLPYYYTKTRNATRWQLSQALDNTENPIAKAAFISAMGEDPENYASLISILDKTEDVNMRTACIEALTKIVKHKDFYLIYQSVARINRKKIWNLFKQELEKGDEGAVGLIADAIASPEAGLTELVDSVGILQSAKANLSMPGQIESIHAMERAIAAYRGVKQPQLSPVDERKALEWSILNQYKGPIKAIVKTNKGNFSINLKVAEAPISVLNFLQLAQKDFYDGLIFHRVVPNFVIQTGSPRNDNYGGEDYVISSELGPSYYDDEGYVGMASAGPHTESTQWFVTYSPAPHLDGRYTIFGKVFSGMEVVHSLTKGDEILDVIISDL